MVVILKKSSSFRNAYRNTYRGKCNWEICILEHMKSFYYSISVKGFANFHNKNSEGNTPLFKPSTGSPVDSEQKPESSQLPTEVLFTPTTTPPLHTHPYLLSYSPPASQFQSSWPLCWIHTRYAPASGPFHCCDLRLKCFSLGYPHGTILFPISNHRGKSPSQWNLCWFVWFVHWSAHCV